MKNFLEKSKKHLCLEVKTMATTEEKTQMQKLTANNYHNWNFDMKMVLVGKDLWDIVDGVEVIAEEDSEDKKKDFRKRDQKAMSIICLGVSPEMKIYVRQAKTSKGA